jgi:hypothetical protein
LREHDRDGNRIITAKAIIDGKSSVAKCEVRTLNGETNWA